MRKLVTAALVLAVTAGCHGTTKVPGPLRFPGSAENRLRYRIAVTPPFGIEKHPLTLYAKRIHVQKSIINALDTYSRFSTCVIVPARESGDLSKEIKIARKRGADFLLKTDITRFEASFQGRNGRIFAAYPLAFTFFGLPIAWDIDAKTWRGDADMDVAVIDCASGQQVYSSEIQAESYGNFSRWEELKEESFGKNYIRYCLGRDILNNLMVALLTDLNDNFIKSLTGEGETVATPAEEAAPAPEETPTSGSSEAEEKEGGTD